MPVDFTPRSPYPYADQLCHGIELIVTDRNVLDSPELGLEIASEIHKLFGDKYQLNKIETLLANRSVLDVLQAGHDPQRIAEDWQEAVAAISKSSESPTCFTEASEVRSLRMGVRSPCHAVGHQPCNFMRCWEARRPHRVV